MTCVVSITNTKLDHGNGEKSSEKQHTIRKKIDKKNAKNLIKKKKLVKRFQKRFFNQRETVKMVKLFTE